MKKIFDSPTFWGIVIGIVMILLMINWLETRAQNVILRNDTFICVDSVKSKQAPTLTKYFYRTTDGTKYPIYMSASGKCFIFKTSKKGKRYKEYLPEITKLWNQKSIISRDK